MSSTTTGTIQYFVILRKQKLFKSDSVRILQGTGTGTGTLQINFYYSTTTPIDSNILICDWKLRNSRKRVVVDYADTEFFNHYKSG